MTDAEWACNSNEALKISLLSPSSNGLKRLHSFHPKFTYHIFDDETIYGYEDLEIDLRFRASDMRPHLRISYGERMPNVGDVKALDIRNLLEVNNHLPKIAFVKESDFEESSKQFASSYTPPGSLYKTIEDSGTTYEIWKGSLSNPTVKQMISRVQILVPLFIEGGSYIGQEEAGAGAENAESDLKRWTVFFLYQKQKTVEGSPYVFVGYSTVYRFFYFSREESSKLSSSLEVPAPQLDLATLPCRSRLSQFVILPPFQGKGNGARLYSTIFDHYLRDNPQTAELTVEDPNEAFDDLRDVSDLIYLRTVPEFSDLHLNAKAALSKTGVVPRNLVTEYEALEGIRKRAKIAPRQFSRVLEMHLMSKLPTSVRPEVGLIKMSEKAPKPDQRLYKLWEVLVKSRLYRHNSDALAEFDAEERLEKLHQAFISVELEFSRIVDLCERRVKKRPATQMVNGKRKPKAMETDDNNRSKKARFDDAQA